MIVQLRKAQLCVFALFSFFAHAQNVGIGTNAPTALLHANGTATGEGNVLFTGTWKLSNPGPPPVAGAGTRMMWYPDKAAFRVGYLSPSLSFDTLWNQQNIGNFSIAMGDNTLAKGLGSVALGSGSRATETYAVALGGGRALNFNAFSMGYTSTASGYGSTAIGESVGAENDYTIAMGAYALARGRTSVAIGNGVQANGESSVGIGGSVIANGAYAMVTGRGTYANGFGSMVVGRFNDSIIARETTPGANTPLFIVGSGSDFNNRSNALVVRANNRLGIATNNPQYQLAIGEDDLGIGSPAAGAMAFYTNGLERMRLSPVGFVGIGTPTPATLLELRSASTPTLRIGNNTTGAVRIDLQRFGTGSAAGFDWRIQNEGGLLLLSRSEDDLATVEDLYQFSNIRFRPIPDNTLALGASTGRWTIVYATNGTINTSDARLKEQIEPVGYGLKEVMQMKPVSYHWKDNPSGPANLGFLAQDMQQIVPETVHDPGSEGPLGMKYSELIPVLVKAIQELKMENEQYRERLERLEGKKR